MQETLPYTTYSEYLNRLFPGIKVQKISLNAGFSCPNRDGTISRGGCIYCDNSSFTPSYCMSGSDLATQLEAGKRFFARKYKEMRFLAYFQSFTGTFVNDSSRLEAIYRAVIADDDVVGLIIGTRPDCLPEEVLDTLQRISTEKPVIVELGAETSFNKTLQEINRGHTWDDVVASIEQLASRRLHPGIHLIAGLPGETPDMVIETVRKVIGLPVENVKFHHMQVIQGTELERRFISGTAQLHEFSLESYLDLCEKIIAIMPRRIAIERFLASAPPQKVMWPKWGIKNYQFTNLLHNRIRTKVQENLF